MVQGKVCALCHRKQVVVYYDGVDMPIGLCCINRANRFANNEEVERAIDALLDERFDDIDALTRRLGW